MYDLGSTYFAESEVIPNLGGCRSTYVLSTSDSGNLSFLLLLPFFTSFVSDGRGNGGIVNSSARTFVL